MKTVKPYLDAILRAIDKIEQLTPKDEQVFMQDLNAQDATLMRLLDIGETMAVIRDKFPDEYQNHYNHDFPKIISLRNIIAHEYAEVDLSLIREVLHDKLPTFKEIIRNWLAD